jgi:hypothetical protein
MGEQICLGQGGELVMANRTRSDREGSLCRFARGKFNVYVRFLMSGVFPPEIVLGTIELGRIGILIDLYVLLVLSVMLFVVTTAPIWSLGLMYWRSESHERIQPGFDLAER